MNKKTGTYLLYYLIDFAIYGGSFALLFFAVESKIKWDNIYLSYFFPYMLSGGVASFLSQKFSFEEKDYSFARFYYSFVLMLGFIAAYSFFISAVTVPRFTLLSSLFLSVIIEFLWVKFILSRKYPASSSSKRTPSLKIFLFNFVILTLSFYPFFRDHISFRFVGLQHLYVMGVYLSWFISSKMTYNFSYVKRQGYWRLIWPYIKSYILLIALSLFLLFIIQFDENTNLGAVLGLSIFFSLSFLANTYYYLSRTESETDEVAPGIFKAPVLNIKEIEERLALGKYILGKDIAVEGFGGEERLNGVGRKLKEIYLKGNQELYNRISNKIDLNSIDITQMVVLRSRDEFNVEVLPENSLQLFVNLHEINDIRRLNAYNIAVNKRLIGGGVYIGRVEPIKNRYKRFLATYPTMLGRIFYFFDFIWRRAIPKIPVLQKFYFSVTGGRNRAISFAESLGRLYYCGFRVLDVYEIENFVYFIAIKSENPSTDKNPSYGPLFKMRRVGKGGKEIYVYKVRTMHPYSEYLQKFMFDTFGSKSGDKVNEDFRITFWGGMLRKFWIDELPMLINWARGELKLVGVRPLSLHKFKMYPLEIQEFRSKFKPGLVPPFYADLPDNFNDLIDSELNYLKSYEKRPLRTDARYFFKAFYNIIFKKARSG